MILLLGTGIGVLVTGAAAGARHRARNRWVSPYADLATAMRRVTRTEEAEFRATSGIVGLRAVPTYDAEIIDFPQAVAR